MEQTQVDIKTESSEKLGLMLGETAMQMNQLYQNYQAIRNLLIERHDKNELKQTEQPLENTDDRTTTV